MYNRWRRLLPRFLVLGIVLCAGAGANAQPASALSLNPLDYYSYDYDIVLSHTEVEPGESFSVTASASVRCTRDLPFGVREAVIRFRVLARNSASGEEITLLDEYDFIVSDVPDWEGDEYSTTETVNLEFPDDTTAGTYVITSRLEYLSLDGWNVTSMVPSSARTMGLGSIACVLPDESPVPEPTPQPGVLVIAVLGHEFRPAIDGDGILQDAVDSSLVEGQLWLTMEEGTRCVDSSGTALTYVSAAQEASPHAYEGGAVLSAFSLRPNGATFSPSLQIGISYDTEELPPGCDEEELTIGYYDRTAGRWRELPSTVNTAQKVVSADVSHFTSFGLLAPTTSPGPARFTVRSLDVSPAQVAPFGRVNVAITIANIGDTEDSYPLVVSIDGQPEHSESVDLEARQSRTIRLTVARSQPGVYEVRVEGLSKSFAVVALGTTAPSNDVPAPDSPTPTSTDTGESPDTAGDGGLHPVYIVLLALAGIAFVTLVVLILAGAL